MSDLCTKCGVKPADNDGRDAARILAVTNDASLLDEDSEVDDLFERGLIRTERDYTDEYHAVMTEAGAAFVRLAVNGEPEPVAEVIPVAVLRELRAWVVRSRALPPDQSGEFEAGKQYALGAVVGWLDEHTRKEPRP